VLIFLVDSGLLALSFSALPYGLRFFPSAPDVFSPRTPLFCGEIVKKSQ